MNKDLQAVNWITEGFRRLRRKNVWTKKEIIAEINQQYLTFLRVTAAEEEVEHAQDRLEEVPTS